MSRPIWLSAGGIVLVAVLAIAVYAAWLSTAVRDAEDAVARLESIDVAVLGAGDREDFQSAARELAAAAGVFASLDERLAPVRVAAAVAGWVPWAGDQLSAAGLILERVRHDVAAAENLLLAAGDLAQVQRALTSGERPARELMDSAGYFYTLRFIETRASDAIADLNAAAELSEQTDGKPLIAVFRSRLETAIAQEATLRRLAAVVSAAPDTLRSASAAVRVAVELSRGLDIFMEGGPSEGLASSAADLARIAREGKERSRQLVEASADAVPGTSIERLALDTETAFSALADLATGLDILLTSLAPSLEILQSGEGSLLKNGEIVIEALELLDSASADLSIVSGLLNRGVDSLASLGPDNALLKASGISGDITARLEDLRAVSDVVAIAPGIMLDILGRRAARTFLVLGQTSDELRAAGGFTSSVWTMRFANGALESVDFIPILQFEKRTRLAQVQGPPEALQVHMNAGATYLRDVGWDPNFPTVARLAIEINDVSGAEPVDGVIAVTQWALIRLIDAIGGVTTPDGFVAAGDVLQLIEDQTDELGTGYLQQIFEGFVESLNTEALKGSQLDLARALFEILSRKDLMIYSTDPGLQMKLESAGWAGTFPTGRRDRLAIIDSNVGWSKADRSIKRTAEYRVDLSDPTAITATLSLSYRHTGLPIGRSCETQSPPSSADNRYAVAKHSCYWDYFRAYVALGASQLSAPDLPLPVNSVADRTGRIPAGTQTFSHSFDGNGDHFSGLFNIEPGGGQKFEIAYRLPATVIEQLDEGIAYRLDLVAQSGARGRPTLVEITLPAGHRLSSSSHDPLRQEGARVIFEFDLLQDETLEITTSGIPVAPADKKVAAN